MIDARVRFALRARRWAAGDEELWNLLEGRTVEISRSLSSVPSKPATTALIQRRLGEFKDLQRAIRKGPKRAGVYSALLKRNIHL